mgnify:FL=1
MTHWNRVAAKYTTIFQTLANPFLVGNLGAEYAGRCRAYSSPVHFWKVGMKLRQTSSLTGTASMSLAGNGPLLTGRALWQALGYTTAAAFYKAAERSALPIPVFRIRGRAGRFAFTQDVESWLWALKEDVAGRNVLSHKL